MKKIVAWTKGFFTWVRRHLSIVVTTVVILSLVGVGAYVIVKSVHTADSAQAIPQLVGTQTAVVTNVIPPTITNGDLGNALPKTYLPTTVYPSTTMLHLLKKSPPGALSYAAMNDSAKTTAVAITPKGSDVPTSILATRYLPEQSKSFVNVYTKAKTPVNAVSSIPTAATSSGATGAPAQQASGSRGSAFTGSGSSVISFNNIMSILTPIIFIFALISIFMWLRRLRKEKKGDFSTGMGSKKSKGPNAEISDVTFADIAGCEEATNELQEMVAFLKNPETFTRVGANPPRGALLVGPPGTGKTLLARAVAGEAEVPFYAVSGSDFVEMYVGVGSKRMRDLFAKARSSETGAIIFIDEIDAVGRKRDSSGGGHVEHENTLNALLVEMDGFTKSKVVVIGATNREDILDPALLRPDRLSKQVHVPLPDRLGREKIIRVHMRGKPISSLVDIELVARRVPGMSGAELAQLVNEACMQTARDNRDEVTVEDFDHAVATVAMGRPRNSAVVTDHDRRVTAWHEAGHTTAAMVLPDADDPVSVSIIPRGIAGGITWMAGGDDLFLTRRRAFAQLVVAMAGRAAEEILLEGEFTSGPHGDLAAATNTALAMVTKYGMTDAGLMIRSDGLLSTGSQVTDSTVIEVEKLLAEGLNTARLVLAEHKDLMRSIVDGLMDKDTLIATDLEEIRAQFSSKPPILPPAPREYRKNQPPAVVPQIVSIPRKRRENAFAKEPTRARLVGAVKTLRQTLFSPAPKRNKARGGEPSAF